MISAKVNVVQGFGAEFSRRVNAQVRDALADASKRGAETASRASEPRRRTGRMAEIEPVPVRGTPTGWEAGFSSKAFYARFQSEGTLGSRRRRAKASTLRRRQSASGQARLAKLGSSGGIPALGFLEKGRSEARKYLLERLRHL